LKNFIRSHYYCALLIDNFIFPESESFIDLGNLAERLLYTIEKNMTTLVFILPTVLIEKFFIFKLFMMKDDSFVKIIFGLF